MKQKIRRRVRVRQRPKRVIHATAIKIINQINSFERKRRRIKRQKPQNYSYRNLTDFPVLNQNTPTGSLSAPTFNRPFGYSELENIKKMIEARVRAEIPGPTKLIEAKPATSALSGAIQNVPLGSVPQDIADYYHKREKRLGKRTDLINFMKMHRIPYKEEDTRYMMWGRIAIWDTQHNSGLDEKGLENVLLVRRKQLKNAQVPEMAVVEEVEPTPPPRDEGPRDEGPREEVRPVSAPTRHTLSVTKKRGFLSRLFGRKKDDELDEEDKRVDFEETARQLAFDSEMDGPPEHTLPDKGPHLDVGKNTLISLEGHDQKEIEEMLRDNPNSKIVHYGSGKKVDKSALWSDQIDTILHSYRQRGYLGCFNYDEVGTLVPQALCIPGLTGDLGKPVTNRFSFIVNTLKASDPEDEIGHWFAVYCDTVNDKALEIYDSLAEEPKDEFLEQIKPVVDCLNLDYYLKAKFNTVRHQAYNTALCGWHAINFIMERYKGIPFRECTGFDNQDPEMRKVARRFGYIC